MFKRLSKSTKKSAQPNHQPAGLSVEALEERMMLSTVEVFAAGETGRESFFLLLDGEVVETVENVGGDFEARDFQSFSFDFDEPISADRISIEFFNDTASADGTVDNNLFVDKIVIDGQTFETEAPTTFHTGLVSGNEVIGPGFLETEVLNINGTVTFFAQGTAPPPAPHDDGGAAAQTGTRIRIDARGETGEENLQLQIDHQVVANFRFDQANTDEVFFFNSDEVIDPSRIKVLFTNDAIDPVTGADRNLFVRSLQTIDRTTGEREIFYSANPSVFSNRSFVAADGVNRSGFGLGGALVNNAFLTFNTDATTIRVDTIGHTGTELFEVLVDDEVVGTFQASTYATSETVTLPGDIDLSRVKIRFINDFDNGVDFDRNLTVLGFQTINRATGDRQLARGTDVDVFSTGTPVQTDGLQQGFGRGRTLVNNGFFEFRPAVV